ALFAAFIHPVEDVLAIRRNGDLTRFARISDLADGDVLERHRAVAVQESINAIAGGGEDHDSNQSGCASSEFVLTNGSHRRRARGRRDTRSRRTRRRREDSHPRFHSTCDSTSHSTISGRRRAAGLAVALHALEVATQVGSGLVAQVAILLQQLVDALLELGWKCRVELNGWSRVPLEYGIEDHGGCVAGERQRAGRHLIEDGAEREQISARIECFSACLFRRHVSNGANGRTRTRKVSRRVLGGPDGFHVKSADELGQTEVQNLHRASLRNEYVRRFDIAVDDSFCVRGIKGVGELNADVKQAVQRQRTAGKLGVQTLAFQQLHRNERLAAVVLYSVDGADVGMIKGRRGAGFEQKTLQRGGIAGKIRREKLQGHATSEAEILGFVNYAHSTAAELAGDSVMRDSLPDH